MRETTLFRLRHIKIGS